MGRNFDMEEAIEKATEFLEEHHSTINLKSAELENNIWIILFDVGFLSEQFKEVKVDVESGKILGYVDIGEDEENDDD